MTRRGFFGTLATHDVDGMRLLQHGAIIHGGQFLGEDRRRELATYFSRKTGVARALEAVHRDRAQRVGVVGLGAGVMLATRGWAMPGRCTKSIRR